MEVNGKMKSPGAEQRGGCNGKLLEGGGKKFSQTRVAEGQKVREGTDIRDCKTGGQEGPGQGDEHRAGNLCSTYELLR